MAEKRSAAFMLFHKWVGWRVPDWTTISTYMSQEHGLFLPEDEKKARAILLNKKTVYMRPFEVAVYAETGAALDVHDPHDGIIVYGYIMEHLADWLNYMQTPHLTIRKVPMEGLRQFNALARKLFPVANRYGYFKKPEVTMVVSVQALFGEVRLETERHQFNDTIMHRIEQIYRRRGGIL